MNKKKIFNDPVYGFISIPFELVFDLIEHPYVQRLRRIKQVSLTHYVYPGALHTRFHHALGALHLMTQALEVLRSKGTPISEAEAEAACAAILLHDIGHGPFSHTLERTLINVPHETLSLLFMERLNEEFAGRLDLAIQIFRDEYPRKFFHQLVSGQLDMDRLDYLTRDSFFTGVYEGVVGYDRIIKMLAVQDDELVVEEKGIYSIEKFLIARRLMYWQVYLHKTVLSVEQMLVKTLERAKALCQTQTPLPLPPALDFFLRNPVRAEDFAQDRDHLLEQFARLDDFDIVFALKSFAEHEDPLLAYLASSILHRRLFKVVLRNQPFSPEERRAVMQRLQGAGEFSSEELDFLVFFGEESNSTYLTSKDEIKILYKSGEVRPMSENPDHEVQAVTRRKYYLCYPKYDRKGQRLGG